MTHFSLVTHLVKYLTGCANNIIDMMIDILLDEVEQPKSQLFNSSSRDSLAVQTLLQLSTVTLHRKNRERIMRSWIPIRAEKSKSSREIKWTTPSILALKIKMMRFPMFYEVSFANCLCHLKFAHKIRAWSSNTYKTFERQLKVLKVRI